MFYDQSWMGYGFVGGLQAGAIALAIGCLMLLLVHWLTRKQAWSHGRALGVAYLLSLPPSCSGDLWNLIYFNYADLESPFAMHTALVGVHDPDSLGIRVLCEFVGAALGVSLVWFGLFWRARGRAGGA
jgi:4-amino-4-deoxy-L-arabinose transferase-like glycosyltransferase